MISYEKLKKIMKKRIGEEGKNLKKVGVKFTSPVNTRQILDYLISLGGVEYLAYKNGFYDGLVKPSKSLSAIRVLTGAMLILYTDKNENEETSIKKVFNEFTKKNIVDIFPPSDNLLTPREPAPAPTPAPAQEQEILDLSFIPTTAQKQVILPINIKYDPVLDRERLREKRRLYNMGLEDFDAPEREQPIEQPIEEQPIEEEPIVEEQEEDLTEGQKRALTKIVSDATTRQDLGWYPNEEDEEDGGEWMDFEEAEGEGEEVLDKIILKGSQYLLDEAKGLIDDAEEEEEEEEKEEKEEKEEEKEEEFTPDTAIQQLVEETEEVLNRPFTPVAPPVIIPTNILDFGNLDGSSVPSPVVLSSPSVASELSQMDNLTPEDYAQMPVYTKKGNIVEPEQRKRENESKREKRYRLQRRREIRNIESLGNFEFGGFEFTDVYTDFLRGNIKETAKTEEELPNWLDEIMSADWTAVTPNYQVVGNDRPRTGEMLIDVIERRVEEYVGNDAEEVLGMPTENYTKYQVLESNLDLEEFVGKDWKDKMRLNLRAIQRKKMRNQPYKKDLPLGERTLPVVEVESSEEEY